MDGSQGLSHGEAPADHVVRRRVGRAPPRTSFETAAAEGDFIIVPSEYVARRAAAVFPEVRMRLRVVRPGLDLAKHAPEGVSRERVAKVRQAWGAAAHEKVVLSPARLAPGRGQKTLIEAAALIKSHGLDDVHFVLAGDAAKPAFARELDALAVTRGVKGMLIRVGASTDLPAALVAAAVVVFPAVDAQGVTRTAIEAAAMGALTIISDVGPAREIIVRRRYADADARTGWLFPHARAGRACRGDPCPRCRSALQRATPSGAGRGRRSPKPIRLSA